MKNLKPFDLQAALSGKAVMLRDGRKAYVRHHETELAVNSTCAIFGYASEGTALAWCACGHYLEGRQTNFDIIGMYPETRIINGFEVPAPESKEPEYGARYYLAAPDSIHFYGAYAWSRHELNNIWLKRGLVFLNEEDAVTNAKAMLGIDPYSETES